MWVYIGIGEGDGDWSSCTRLWELQVDCGNLVNVKLMSERLPITKGGAASFVASFKCLFLSYVRTCFTRIFPGLCTRTFRYDVLHACSIERPHTHIGKRERAG